MELIPPVPESDFLPVFFAVAGAAVRAALRPAALFLPALDAVALDAVALERVAGLVDEARPARVGRSRAALEAAALEVKSNPV